MVEKVDKEKYLTNVVQPSGYRKLRASMVEQVGREKYLAKAVQLSGQNGAVMFVWIFHGRPVTNVSKTFIFLSWCNICHTAFFYFAFLAY